MEWGIFWIVLAILWSLPWLSWGLWKSARNKQKIWFMSIFFMGELTVGVLPILYIFFYQKDKNGKKSKILKSLHSTKAYEIFKTGKDFRKRKSKKIK